jgi:glucan phosphoethanolaminetransferase (alkaline phosphatase superfamily)
LIPTMFYNIPVQNIEPIYSIEETICVSLIIVIVIVSLFEMKKLYVRILTTIFSLLVVILHYYIYYELIIYEEIKIMPLTIIETTRNGSVIGIDYGQILIISLIYIWRKQLINSIKALKGLIKIL